MPLDASQFDDLFVEGDTFAIGNLQWRVMETPGHTPGCVTYLVEDAAFVGDVLLQPDIGTARADFPGGDAGILFDSIQRLLSLPSDTHIFTCHDYPPPSRTPESFATVSQHLQHNILVNKDIDKASFVQKRTARDTHKPPPRLLYPSLQANLRAGQLRSANEEDTQPFQSPFPIDSLHLKVTQSAS